MGNGHVKNQAFSGRPGVLWHAMNATYISDRLTSLKQEIHELRNLSARYRSQTAHSQADQSAYELQQLRLLHLKHEFCDLLKHSFRMRTEGESQKPEVNCESKSA